MPPTERPARTMAGIFGLLRAQRGYPAPNLCAGLPVMHQRHSEVDGTGSTEIDRHAARIEMIDVEGSWRLQIAAERVGAAGASVAGSDWIRAD